MNTASAFALTVTLALALGQSSSALSQDRVAAIDPALTKPEVARQPRPEPSKLLLELAADIAKYSTYAAPTDFPRVSQVSHEELAAHACGGPCRLVRAAFVPGEGIYLDASVDAEHSTMDRSIVFHEYVHFVQQQQGTYAHLDDCARMRAEELEAYAVQNRYLAASGGQQIYLPPNAFRCH